MSRVWLLLVCLLFSYAPIGVHAQVQPFTLILDHVPIAPGDVVEIQAQSFSFDTESTMIEWFEGGVLKASGVGLATQSFTLGGVGEERLVSARAVGVTGEVFGEDTLLLTPASVDIVWEGSVYTHPFYRGRKLPSGGTVVHAEARTQFINQEGAPIPHEELYYEWRVNEKIMTSLSGKGSRTVEIPISSPFGDTSLSVTASSPEHGISASMKVRVPSTLPQLTLYPADPLLGIDFAHAVARNHFASDLETTLILVPQFAAMRTLRDSAARIEWRVDGKEVPPHTDDQARITFVADTAGVETALEARFSMENNSFQDVRSVWKITFDTVAETALDLFRPSVDN